VKAWVWGVAAIVVVSTAIRISETAEREGSVRGRRETGRVLLLLQEGVEAEALVGAEGPLGTLPGGAAVALMNTAVHGPQSSASAYLTLGHGGRAEARGGVFATSAYRPAERMKEVGRSAARGAGEPDQPAGEVYSRRVGRPPDEAWLLLPALPSLGGLPPERTSEPAGLRQGAERPRPGALVEALRRQGRRVALLVVGEPPPQERLGALVAMDARGVVSRGAFADAEAAAMAASRLLERNDLGIVDLGRAGGAVDLPRFLPRLTAQLDPRRDTLLAVVPAPRPREGVWDRLTPVLAWGRGVPPGLLLTRTTRTPGLVANIDVAPTVLAWLEVSHAPMGGHPMRVRPWAKGESPADLLALSHRVTLNRKALYPLLVGLGAIAILTLALILGALAWPTPRRRATARVALLTVAASPLALLGVPGLGPPSVLASASLTFAYAAALAVAANLLSGWMLRRGRPLSPLLVLYLMTVAALIGDLALGGRAIAASVLSDYALAGFRFYGIGNEYAGVLVGMTAVGISWSVEAFPALRRGLPGLFLLIGAFIGLPALGANLGGAVTAAAAFAVTLRLFAPKGRLVWTLCLLVGLMLLVALLLILLDAVQPEEQRTHIGQLAERLLDGTSGGGAVVLAEVARRKSVMNLHLITGPIALWVLAAVVPLLILGYHGTRRRLSTLLARRSAFRAGVVGAAAGGAVGLVVNDSGIVVWGMTTAAALAAVLEALLAEKSVPGGHWQPPCA
jgi:hypothetical protein